MTWIEICLSEVHVLGDASRAHLVQVGDGVVELEVGAGEEPGDGVAAFPCPPAAPAA